MATEQKFDDGIMLAYDDMEAEGRIVFALYDHGQWSQWRSDDLWRSEDMELAVPVGATQITYSFARAWADEKLSSILGYASEEPKHFVGSWHRVSDGGHRITDSLGRVLLLERNGLQTWRFLRMSRTDDLMGELEY